MKEIPPGKAGLRSGIARCCCREGETVNNYVPCCGFDVDCAKGDIWFDDEIGSGEFGFSRFRRSLSFCFFFTCCQGEESEGCSCPAEAAFFS